MTRGSLYFNLGLGFGEEVAEGAGEGFGGADGDGAGLGLSVHPINVAAIVPAVKVDQARTVRREAWPEDLDGRLSTD